MQITAAPPAAAKTHAPPASGLINLSARVLELALKLRVRAVGLSKEVRPYVEKLLRQLEDDAVTIQCHPSQVDDVKFALVAFFDETVLSLDNSPLRQEWAREPLQLVYFDRNWAGDVFFEQLNELLRDPAANADVIEVYYLCLLLGFKGKYSIGLSEGEDEDMLRDITSEVSAKLRSVGRLSPNKLSGHWRVADQPPEPRGEWLPLWAKVGGATLLAVAFFTYIILYALLQSNLNVVR
jgi:type VI secretion system protein ImpK